jgi:hypothetical protein
MPCARCRSSGAVCIYERLGHASSSATPNATRSQASDADTSASRQRGGISIEFLLSFTNPSGYRPSAAIAAEAAELSTIDGEASPLQPQLRLEDHQLLHEQSFSDIADVSSMFFGFPFMMFGTEDEYAPPIITSGLPPCLDEAYALEVRLRELIHHLSVQYSSMLERKNGIQTNFNFQLAETLFTVGNVRHCVWSFFHYFHYSFPILHKPSMDIQTVSLPLLLTLILFGSMSSNLSDASITIRQFSHVAEAYVFDQVVSRQMIQGPQATCIDNEELELLQAGLLFLVFLNNSNDFTTRRRLRLQRIPSLVTAVRASGLFAYKRQYFSPGLGTHDWQGFIFDELRLR